MLNLLHVLQIEHRAARCVVDVRHGIGLRGGILRSVTGDTRFRRSSL